MRNGRKRHRNKRGRHWARRTHRVLGMSSLLFVLLISLSGLVLNHADGLGLSRTATGPWVLSLYGIEAPPVDSAYVAGGNLFATSAETLYANGAELARGTGHLIGAVAVGDTIVIATGNEFFVMNSNAELIERFSPIKPASMSHIGVAGENIMVAIEGDLAEFDMHQMNLLQTSVQPQDIHWSQPITPGAEHSQQIGTAALGQAINWERVLLDFHSGRILPGLGRWLADLTAIALLYMCCSGIVLWARRR